MSDITAFQRIIFNFYTKHGRRHLPWRLPAQAGKTRNPYRILVSEVMLQQTQVERVIPYYRAFLKKFPTVRALAGAPLGEVLRAWQGLGYNRRAKALHEAAKITMINHSGRVPRAYADLAALPGVGEYTAKAVRVFAFNESETLIETNVRAVFIHHFFQKKNNIPDRTIVQLTGLLLDTQNPREWYAALMDYGAHLKKTHPNPSRKSAHHTKQKPLKGSNREIRGALLRAATRAPLSRTVLAKLPFEKGCTELQLQALVREGLLIKDRRTYTLPL